MFSKIKLKILFVGIIILVVPFFASADRLGQQLNFFVDPSYDLYGRERISTTLIKITNQLYFYIDETWWDKLDYSKKMEIDAKLYNLGSEFEYKIYPTLTSTFGSIPEPGIDKDERITILIHPMIKDAGGYFNSGDVYFKLQYPRSNQREMVYLNSQHIDKPEAKSLLAHEFMHLITVNQKDLLRGTSEEIWLNEARAEYTSTLLGYDTEYKGSNLERRVKIFIEKTTNSLTEWLNEKSDYGVVNLFTQFLADHYGLKILVDSLQSEKVGISSINYALAKNGFKEDFSQIFTDWTIAVLVNDCNLGEKYCYKNENLKSLKIVPTSNFLPLTSEISLSVGYTTKNWAGNWHKIFGGKGTLTLEFEGTEGVKFKVPYLVCQKSNSCSINFFTLDENQKDEIVLPDFNEKYAFLTIIPSIQNKFSGFNGSEKSYSFYLRVTAKEEIKEKKEEELIKQLLAQIATLKAEIAKIQAQIAAILGKKAVSSSCAKLESNLYFGLKDNQEVRCLQEFLKNQGPNVYPEGLVTGNFLSLTKSAVIRFQEKYALEILNPLGLERGTGYVGVMTRTKINELIVF